MKTEPDTTESEQELREEIEKALMSGFFDQRAFSSGRLPGVDDSMKITPKKIAVDNLVKLFATHMQQATTESRITTLTDVDNLNLLNDSDAWHDFYLQEVAKLRNNLADRPESEAV